MASCLVAAAADLTLVDKMGMTALHYGCYVGALPMVQLLLNASATPLNWRDKYGRTPVYLATCRGHTEVVNYLLSKGETVGDRGRVREGQSVCKGVREGRRIRMNFVFRTRTDYSFAGSDIHLTNKENKSPLYISAYFGHLEIANALLRSGAKVDQADSHNKTALYVATYHGRSDIVNLLLNCNTNVNAADKNGKRSIEFGVVFSAFI